jgi:E3 ubiquitin-protein ligase SIAH1
MGDVATLVSHLRDDHKVDMHNGCTFNHRYVKSNPQQVQNATWMLTVSNAWAAIQDTIVDELLCLS